MLSQIPNFDIVNVYKIEPSIDPFYSIHIKLDSGIEIKGLNLCIKPASTPLFWIPCFLGFDDVKKKWVKVPIITLSKEIKEKASIALSAKLYIWLKSNQPKILDKKHIPSESKVINSNLDNPKKTFKKKTFKKNDKQKKKTNAP